MQHKYKGITNSIDVVEYNYAREVVELMIYPFMKQAIDPYLC